MRGSRVGITSLSINEAYVAEKSNDVALAESLVLPSHTYTPFISEALSSFPQTSLALLPPSLRPESRSRGAGEGGRAAHCRTCSCPWQSGGGHG